MPRYPTKAGIIDVEVPGFFASLICAIFHHMYFPVGDAGKTVCRRCGLIGRENAESSVVDERW
jgi:hypothetical protein